MADIYRIKEIEEHIKREFIETIQDPSETLDLIHETISSATKEIMIMFPTIRSFQVYEREGILNLIKRQLENRITVRMLLSEKDRPPQRGKKFLLLLIFKFNIRINYHLVD